MPASKQSPEMTPALSRRCAKSATDQHLKYLLTTCHTATACSAISLFFPMLCSFYSFVTLTVYNFCSKVSKSQITHCTWTEHCCIQDKCNIVTLLPLHYSFFDVVFNVSYVRVVFSYTPHICDINYTWSDSSLTTLNNPLFYITL